MKKLVIIGVPVIVVLAGAWWLWGENIQLVLGGQFTPPEQAEIGNRAVSPTLGDILLFKSPSGQRGAIRFDRMSNDWGADYTSWYIPPGSTSPPKVFHGHVFEKYWHTRTSKNSHNVKDIGGDYQMECGPLSFEWSAATWVYLPKGYVFGFASDGVEEPNFDSVTLTWHTSGDQQDGESHE